MPSVSIVSMMSASETAWAGVRAGADAVKSTSADDMTIGTPLQPLIDPGRDALIAVGMNGGPLPLAHGFPVRMVVPGLYGFVSATKWLVDLEVTRFADFKAYWSTRGYSVTAPINLGSSQLVTIDRLVQIVEEVADIRLERRHNLGALTFRRQRRSTQTQHAE